MDLSELQNKAREIRVDVLKMLHNAGSGHTAGPLGMADIFASLYFGNLMNYDPQNPDWEDRDRLFLSNGHICPVLYTAMSHAGFFPREELMTLRKLGSRLQGHPEKLKLAGLESTSGPLGEGLGQAVGCALALRLDNKQSCVFCITSDGEHNEGSHWEAVMMANKYKLAGLTQIIDNNKIQLSGNTEDIMPMDPLSEKYSAFGWNVLETDGHNFTQIKETIEMSKKEDDKPSVIIAHTTPGKGVSFMENKWEWHGKIPDDMELKRALEELGG